MNYFNYFTEIEVHFQQARQSGVFLLSPLDWALIETWKQADIPLEAVLRGIDRAFEKWHKRKRKFKMVNSLAYCSQEVLDATREMADGRSDERKSPANSGFEAERLAAYFEENAAAVREAGDSETHTAVANSLTQLGEAARAASLDELEAIEQRLSVLEGKLVAAAQQALSEELLLEIRQQMDSQLAPYRRKMSADQIDRLERQFIQRVSLERAGLPRLSLFYLR